MDTPHDPPGRPAVRPTALADAAKMCELVLLFSQAVQAPEPVGALELRSVRPSQNTAGPPPPPRTT